MTAETTPQQLSDDAVLLDVREQDEWDAGHAPNAVHIPMGEVPARLGELPQVEGSLPVICKAGGRSGRVVAWLEAQGYDVINVDGGMGDWARAGKPLTNDSGNPQVI
nr:rhodanese-like domain-containing protein [Demetria terragena]